MSNPTSAPDRETIAWWRLPIVWMVIGGPAIVVVASFVTLTLAIRHPDPVYDTRATSAARLSPPWPANLLSAIHAASASGSEASTSLSGRPRQRPRARSASAESGVDASESASAVWIAT